MFRKMGRSNRTTTGIEFVIMNRKLLAGMLELESEHCLGNSVSKKAADPPENLRSSLNFARSAIKLNFMRKK